jgi:hypothetical protein
MCCRQCDLTTNEGGLNAGADDNIRNNTVYMIYDMMPKARAVEKKEGVAGRLGC